MQALGGSGKEDKKLEKHYRLFRSLDFIPTEDNTFLSFEDGSSGQTHKGFILWQEMLGVCEPHVKPQHRNEGKAEVQPHI